MTLPEFDAIVKRGDWPDGVLGPMDLELLDLNVLRLIFVLSPDYTAGLVRDADLMARREYLDEENRTLETVLAALETGGLIVRHGDQGTSGLTPVGLDYVTGNWDFMPTISDPELDPWSVLLELWVAVVQAKQDSIMTLSRPAYWRARAAIRFYRGQVVARLDRMPSADRALRVHRLYGREEECLVALFENLVAAQRASFVRFLDDLDGHLSEAPVAKPDVRPPPLQIRARDVLSVVESEPAPLPEGPPEPPVFPVPPRLGRPGS